MLRSFGMVALLALLVPSATRGEEMRVYFGTYTGNGSEGIYVADFDTQSGELSPARLAGKTFNPSFLAVHPEGDRLYSVTEGRSGPQRDGAALVGWSIDAATGELAQLGRAEAGGGAPCYVDVRADGAFAAIANYGGGSVAVFPLDAKGAPEPYSSFVQHEGGSVNPRRQSAPHAHAIQFDASGERLLAADLGLDKLLVYDLSEEGELSPATPASVSLAPGSGPRHFAFSPDQRFVLVINELLSTITVFGYDEGPTAELQTISTLPEDFEGNSSTAEILFHPSGRFVYGSNRGHDSLAVFRFDEEEGQLEAVGHVSTGGQTPRNFRLTPDGRWLLAANQQSDNVVVFRVDPQSGMPEPTGVEIPVSRPVCIKFVSRDSS